MTQQDKSSPASNAEVVAWREYQGKHGDYLYREAREHLPHPEIAEPLYAAPQPVQASPAKDERAIEALRCAEYALMHPESDQQFALNAVRAALTTTAQKGPEQPVAAVPVPGVTEALSAATDRAERAERDACRYRWLRGCSPYSSAHGAVSVNWPIFDNGKLMWSENAICAEALDAAIDAAMRSTSGR